MALPQTSLGQCVEIVRGFLSAQLQARDQPSRVDVGNLAANAPANGSVPSLVNLLVIRVESDGSTAGGNHPWEPWLVRLHLLVTAFTTDGSPSIGQNDLRLLGAVAAIFHEHPILDLSTVEGIPVRLNVVPENIATEALNQLWAIQGEVGFRTSLAYEVSLVPVRTDLPRREAPLVGRFVAGAEPVTAGPGAATGAPGAVELALTTPPQHFRQIPRAELAAFAAQVRATGDAASVQLVWELLDTDARWQRLAPAGGLVPAPTGTDLALELPDPADLPAAGAFQLVLRALPDPGLLTGRALPGRPVVLSVFEP